MASAFIAGGEPVYCDAKIIPWDEHGCWFAALRKRTVTRLVVAHWTGGQNKAAKVYETLKTRRDPKTGRLLDLSVHFVVNPDGSVWQMADADMRCAHAGSVDDSDHDGHQESGNAESVGIEIVNPASPTLVPGDYHREVMLETIHGHDFTYTGFTIEQTKAALQLIDALCKHYSLPMRVPMDGVGVLAGVMSEPAFRAFTGVCGHFHLTERKRDPGLAFMRAVRALPTRGFGAAE